MHTTSPTCSTVTVAFGRPEHGWLPVMLQAGDFQLEFFASNVPANPLELLCEALAVVPVGGSAKVMWHLEPAIYWFVFEKDTAEVTLEILEAPRHNQPGTCLLRLTGSMQDILHPFYNALAEFASHKFSEKHWPALATNSVKQLSKLLRTQH